ncbi:MAG TPA: phosphoserine phosphatase SerB [Candidatus Krumholzibacteria bacterium]|nr:phosphoserine phosphatase SerB [Candidatus Krumholzibacteria bacterium]
MTAAVIRWLADDARAATEIETILDRREVERGRVELSGVAGLTRAEIEIDSHGSTLRAELLAAAREHTFSVGLVPAVHRDVAPGWIAFDADSTLVDAEGIDRLAERAGVGPAVSALTARAMRGELDYEASLRERTKRLAGLAWSEVEAEAADLPLVPGAIEAVSTARDRGWHVAVISGGFLPLVEAVARRLRLDHATAHELEVIDDRLSGRICGPVIDAAAKASILDRLRAGRPAIAVGDGANDAPMLASAGLGVAFGSKSVLDAVADVVVHRHDLRATVALALPSSGHPRPSR